MEKEIIINTGEGQISFKTPKIKGFLNSFIIESEGKIELIIESELGYLILKRSGLTGVNYIAIRERTSAPEEDLRDTTTFDKFKLNESLIITVIGAKNADIKIIIRTD